jgi:uncharacterized membrane protein
MDKHKSSLACIYTLIFLLLGFAQTSVVPPFQVPDEQDHWASALLRVELMTGSRLPFCSSALGLPEHFDQPRIAFSPQERVDAIDFKNLDRVPRACHASLVAYGSPISYFPASLVYAILGKPSSGVWSLFAFYFGRLFQGLLVVSVLAGVIPVLQQNQSTRKAIAAIAILGVCLTPIFIQQIFAVSSDGVVLSFAVLCAVWLLRSRMPASVRGLAFFLVLALAASSTKPIIVPFLLPLGLLLGGKRLFRDGKGFLAVLLVASVVAIYCGLSSNAFSGPRPSGISPSLQLAFIRDGHILLILQVLLSNVWTFFTRWGWMFRSLGWLDYNSSPTTFWSIQVACWCAVAFCLVNQARGHHKVNASVLGESVLWGAGSRILFSVSVLVSALMVSFTLYVVATPVGWTSVYAVQGRYFLPHIILFCGCIGNTAKSVEIRSNTVSWRGAILGYLSVAFVVIYGLSHCVDILRRYWDAGFLRS